MTKVLLAVFSALARLPLGVLFVFADVLWLLLYYIVRYRRKVVRANLRGCFPDKDKAELGRIERQFYRNFADYIAETIKLLHISDTEMRRRMEFANVEVMDNLAEQGQSTVVYFAHVGCWEWAPSVTLHTAEPPSASMCYGQVYRPLRNSAFDALMLKVRARFGSVSIPKNIVLRTLLGWKRSGVCSTTGFMSDQKPSHGDPAVVVDFLGRPTPFISGTETLARKLQMAAIYWDLEKVKRGHYRITCRPIAENVAQTEPDAVTRLYAAMLEQTIKRDPAIWLWSHNRWKNAQAYLTPQP